MKFDKVYVSPKVVMGKQTFKCGYCLKVGVAVRGEIPNKCKKCNTDFYAVARLEERK